MDRFACSAIEPEGVHEAERWDALRHVTFAGSLATIGLIGGVFAIDLFVSRPGHAHTVGLREACPATWNAVQGSLGALDTRSRAEDQEA